jgi:CBS domain containing-hemolysin-like protein
VSTGWAVAVAVVLLAGNAFFVAAEFALVASKRHRLEQAAATGSRAAAAALDGSRELSMMLAGAQLGITLCSLGLGAIAEPALENLLHPLLHAAGLPDVPGEVVAFLFALVVVTFLHLVLGEMMPKSWAISDPERSAVLLAVPFRGFTRLFRPALRVLNGLANAALRPFGVHPQDQLAQAHGPAELQILLDRSRLEGSLEAEQTELLSSLLRLQETTIREVAMPGEQLVSVPVDASAADVELASMHCGRSRLAVVGPGGDIVGVVHVRDAVRATAGPQEMTAADLMDAPFRLDAAVRVTDAVAAMQAARAQIAMVTDGGRWIGFVALEDLLEQVIGRFDDETDPVPVP